jgi:[ribosomal protein S5]-alanine N-acetyltransferase
MVDYQLITKRLLLRRLKREDAPHIVTLAGDYDVAKMTLNIPHPYPADGAIEFIERSQQAWDDGERFGFAIVLKDTDMFMGVIGLIPEMEHRRAGVGYWIGKPYWGNGYVTEALKRIIQFGFNVLTLNRVDASYRVDNPASGRVMEKVGMQLEGTFRQIMFRDGAYSDLSYRAILREDYDAQNS